MSNKFTGQSLCDSSCRGCIYFGTFLRSCEYMIQTGNLRPCPAGKGCTVRTTKRGRRTMAQAIDADAYSYLARKEAQDKITADMQKCGQDGAGVHYGKWKAAQPEPQPQPQDKAAGVKLCLRCGKPIIGRAKNAKYCCDECRDAVYSERDRLTGRHAEKNRQYRERKKRERMAAE